MKVQLSKNTDVLGKFQVHNRDFLDWQDCFYFYMYMIQTTTFQTRTLH
jgi:hypothetical protein